MHLQKKEGVIAALSYKINKMIGMSVKIVFNKNGYYRTVRKKKKNSFEKRKISTSINKFWRYKFCPM